MHLLLFIANKFDFQLIVAVIFHNLWAAITGEHQSYCTLMCLMMLSVACFRGRWNSPSVTEMLKKRKKLYIPVVHRGWFKNYPGLALKWKSEVFVEILLPCAYNLSQVHLLPCAMEWWRIISQTTLQSSLKSTSTNLHCASQARPWGLAEVSASNNLQCPLCLKALILLGQLKRCEVHECFI